MTRNPYPAEGDGKTVTLGPGCHQARGLFSRPFDPLVAASLDPFLVPLIERFFSCPAPKNPGSAMDATLGTSNSVASKSSSLMARKTQITEALAWTEFHRLMVEIADNPPVDGGNPTVASICDEYLERNQSVLASSTLYENRLYLQKFCDRHGPRLVRDCIPYHLVTWVQEHPSWESSWTQSYAIRVVKRAFSWAAEMRLISENPFASVKLPRCQSKRRPIEPEEYQQLLDAAGADSRLGEILCFLRLTGCRPGELRQLRWQDIHMESEFPAIVIRETQDVFDAVHSDAPDHSDLAGTRTPLDDDCGTAGTREICLCNVPPPAVG